MTGGDDSETGAPGPVVRPYVVTGGRTDSGELPFETMVVARSDIPEVLADERRRLVDACRRPMAIAELAARVELPLGIVKVLVDELVRGGHMEAFDTADPDDAAIVRRILDAIRPT